MAALSSPGIGSGLDVAGIVTQLVAAEGAPASARLDKLETRMQARLSGLGTLKGALSDFQSKLTTLGNADNYRGRSVTNSNDKAFTATASSSAVVGDYAINVTALAQSQAIVSDVATPFSSTTDVVGTGSITFKFGTGPIGSFTPSVNTGTYSITIDSTNNTLEGIRNEINSADIGVRASIINNGSGYLLSLTSEHTGADNSMEISVSDLGDGNHIDASGLSRLAYNNLAQNMNETIAAKDAELTINGVYVKNSSNSINGAIDGIDLTLLDTQSGNMSITLDKNGVKNSVTNLVDSYNKLMSTVKDLTGYDPESRVAGVLNGDFGARTISNKIRSIMAQSLGELSNAPFSSLAGVGISLQADGKLAIDDTKLQGALDNNFSDLATLFSAIGRSDDSLVKYVSSSDKTLAGNYAVTIDALATQGVINGQSTGALALNGSGSFQTAFTIDSTNDGFTVKVDGLVSNAITLTNKDYATPVELAAEIQSRINSDTNLKKENTTVQVTFDTLTENFTLISNRYGSASAVSILAVDTNSAATIGFDTLLAGVDGIDVEGSIGGIKATGNGQILSANGDAYGIKLEIAGGAVGSRGAINFSRGIADQLSLYINNYLENNIIDQRITGIEKGVKDIEGQREVLGRRLDALQSRLQAKFSALDALVSQLRSSGDYLTQQLDKISSFSTKK